jgi:tetratricopeptide (TPR) repeat protein
MNSKEYDEAITHYSNSVRLDPEEPTSYCNRALAYIKIKNFEKGLSDCNKAILLKSDYTKAYYRRAVCLMGLSKFSEALNSLLHVLSNAPNNQEVTEEINNLKDKWKAKTNNEDWIRLNIEIDQKVSLAKDPINKEKFTDPITTEEATNTFKKIEIIEEKVQEEEKVSKEISKVSSNYRNEV